MMKARVVLVCALLVVCGRAGGVFAASAPDDAQTTGRLVADDANKATYAEKETAADAVYGKFEWYAWSFHIDPAIDSVGKIGDGIGTLYVRVFTPVVRPGVTYPVVMALGGLGSTNSFLNNNYARTGANFASAAVQAEYPSYVLTFNIPFEACVNYRAELAYVFQQGEVVKALASKVGNVDMNRIYSTGTSQGAGWSYELAAVQPDLLAAILLNAGTTVHTTWGDQCDMKAIARSPVNVNIRHGSTDQFIPVNEAYRAYNTLVALGKTNVVMDISNDGHGVKGTFSAVDVTPSMKWLLTQVKGLPCVSKPALTEADGHGVYKWAGVSALASVDNWQTVHDYARWVEPARNTVWEKVKAAVPAYASGAGGAGAWHLARIRIGDETATTYDEQVSRNTPISLKSGDVLAVTVQGYTGAFGDDWNAFNAEWSVDWAIVSGDVTKISLARAASPAPIVRPATVNLANGGGPNVNNSLFSENALDGRQVYLRIDLAKDSRAKDLKVLVRFTRNLGHGEYASYWHVIACTVG